MGLLMNLNKSRAVEKIARNLPPFLVSGYGSGEFYTSGQVEAALNETECNCDFIDFVYAIFCAEDAFNEVSEGDYESLRADVSDLGISNGTSFSFGDVSAFGGASEVGTDGGGSDGGD